MLDTTLASKDEKKKKKEDIGAITAEEAAKAAVRDDIHEIILNDLDENSIQEVEITVEKAADSIPANMIRYILPRTGGWTTKYRQSRR